MAAPDADDLQTLALAWRALGASVPPDAPRVKALAKRVIAYRATLFATNARLQAEAPSDDDPATVAQIDANQQNIKACTTMLSEMTEALGGDSAQGG